MEDNSDVEVMETRVVKATVEKAWKEITDFSKESLYWSNIRKVKILSEEVNAILREAVVGPLAFGVNTRQKITLEEPFNMLVEFEGDGLKGNRSIKLRKINDETIEITVKWDFLPSHVPDFVRNMIRKQITGTTKEALNKIVKFLDQEKKNEDTLHE